MLYASVGSSGVAIMTVSSAEFPSVVFEEVGIAAVLSMYSIGPNTPDRIIFRCLIIDSGSKFSVC